MTAVTKQVTTIVIGAGPRSLAYAEYADLYPQKFKIVGVADPNKFRRDKFIKCHNISEENVFADWRETVLADKFADCVIISTPDQVHKEPAVAFAKKGYHILLEKPMAVSYEDCAEIVETCKSCNVMLAVGHVLRYSLEARKIHSIIQSGAIGEIVNIMHHEPVGFFHYAHSYVRGSWRNTDTSTFMLLAKCCHDLDLINMWMGNKKCTAVSSFGSLIHFTKQNQPEGAAARCVECQVESSCPFSAKKIYLDPLRQGRKMWPSTGLPPGVTDIEGVTEALRSGPYGRCVYECDNNVVDNQVVNLQFEGGATVSFTVVAFTEKLCQRQTRVFGTKGMISSDFDTKVDHFDFLTRKSTSYNLVEATDGLSGGLYGSHSSADLASIEAFVQAVAMNDPTLILTDPDSSLYSHLLCFAAERSRLENRIIDPTELVHPALD